MKPSFIITMIILQALRRQPMTVYGDGKQTRSFQYVADLVSTAVLLLCVDVSCVNIAH